MKRISITSLLACVLAIGLSEVSSRQSLFDIGVQAQTVPANLRTISVVTNDIIYDPISQKIYASVPSSAGINGNSITVIDPMMGTVGPTFFVGSEPNKLAISYDG